jgi:Type I phosphodiesterase / nucleotide pyrophosphatase
LSFAKPLHMKSLFACIILMVCLQSLDEPAPETKNLQFIPPVQNLVIITIDGFRWQEVFTGADSALINDENFSPDTATMKMLYWAGTPEERRKKLMPFFWNVLVAKGQVYGNRHFDNKVNVSNIYSLSYPGYNEMFTGEPDLRIATNSKRVNPNLNVLEYLNEQTSFKGSVVAFTSWDVFPYILNKERSGLKINSGYGNIETDAEQYMVSKVQHEAVYDKTETRYDELTFITAKEYIRKYNPRVVYLGFGETDESAHRSRYDLYLENAAETDRMIAELWHWVQSTPGYKDNTTFIITTDHGRGARSSKWNDHGSFIKGSSQTWLAVIGPNIKPVGEMRNEEQIYEEQIAQTIAHLVGQNFESNQAVAPTISLQ